MCFGRLAYTVVDKSNSSNIKLPIKASNQTPAIPNLRGLLELRSVQHKCHLLAGSADLGGACLTGSHGWLAHVGSHMSAGSPVFAIKPYRCVYSSGFQSMNVTCLGKSTCMFAPQTHLVQLGLMNEHCLFLVAAVLCKPPGPHAEAV